MSSWRASCRNPIYGPQTALQLGLLLTGQAVFASRPVHPVTSAATHQVVYLHPSAHVQLSSKANLSTQEAEQARLEQEVLNCYDTLSLLEVSQGELVHSYGATEPSPDVLGYHWKTTGSKLGKGTFGKVFEATSTTGLTKHPVSVKTENPNSNKKDLDWEAGLMADLQGPGIAKFYQYMDNRGMPDSRRYLVMEKLGIDLETYRQRCGGKLSLPVVLRLAYQMISRFQHIHEQPSMKDRTKVKKYLFRDTKPNNFMLGWDPEGKHVTNDVYLIDFGLSSYYEDPVFKRHLPQHGPGGERPGFAGTQRYASRNALSRLQQGRRDDMETLGYVWSHLYTGALPWAGLKPELKPGEEKLKGPERDKADKVAKQQVFERQIKAREEAIEKDYMHDKADGSGQADMLPQVLKNYMTRVTSLKHEDRPDYEGYLSMITDYAREHNIDLNGGFVKKVTNADADSESQTETHELKC